MQPIAVILSIISRCAGLTLIAIAALGASGRIFHPTTPADDIAAVSLVALVEGVLYLLPQRVILKNNRRVLLYLAATLFLPFLVAAGAVQYGIQATAQTPRAGANLVSAAAVFVLALCPPASLLVALLRRYPIEPKS